jgi:hypothetical protein
MHYYVYIPHTRFVPCFFFFLISTLFYEQNIGQYYFYDQNTDETSWECPIGNFKKHSSSNLLLASSNQLLHEEDNKVVPSLVGDDGDDGEKGNLPSSFQSPDHHHHQQHQTNNNGNMMNEKPRMSILQEEPSPSPHPSSNGNDDSNGHHLAQHHQQPDNIYNTSSSSHELQQLQGKITELELQIEYLSSALENEKKRNEVIEAEMKESKESGDCLTPLNKENLDKLNNGGGGGGGGRDDKKRGEEEEEDSSSLNMKDRNLTFNTMKSETTNSGDHIGSTPRARFEKHGVNILPNNLSVAESEYLLSTYSKMEVHGLNLSSFHSAVVRGHVVVIIIMSQFSPPPLPPSLFFYWSVFHFPF